MGFEQGNIGAVEQFVYDYLTGTLGYNTAVACGILANAYYESTFNPSAWNVDKTLETLGAYGLFQWRSDRQRELFKHAGKNIPNIGSMVRDPVPVEAQLEYMHYELTEGNESVAYNAIKDLPNTAAGAYEAGKEFATKYERYGGDGAERGVRARDSYWAYYSSRDGEDPGGVSGDDRYGSGTYTGEEIGIAAIEYANLTIHDPYGDYISSNLTKYESIGYEKYGYLIDMTNGGEFKFYIPEYSEQAGVSWSPIEIRGRSVKVVAYESTNSRNVKISLELYAGVGVYEATATETGEDTVTRMHKDVNFVKSLEYPDYSNAITRPPATVHLLLGATLDIVGVVSNVVATHKKPLDSTNRAMYVTLEFTVTQVAQNPPDYRDIRNGQSSIRSASDIDSMDESGDNILMERR